MIFSWGDGSQMTGELFRSNCIFGNRWLVADQLMRNKRERPDATGTRSLKASKSEEKKEKDFNLGAVDELGYPGSR